MKCTNKLKIAVPLMIASCLLLSGCTDRTEVTGAYDLYQTSETYQLTDSPVSNTLSLFAEDLCVGGVDNSSTKDLDYTDYAKTAAVFSVNDKEVAYAQNIYAKKYPASTTKILTAYIALKHGNLEDTITVSDEAISSLMSGSSICGLKPGDQLTLEQALYGLMLSSGNDAANAIAEYISGSTEKFAELMNEEAKALGATRSHFVNAHGLPDKNHYTTAYDLYLIFNEAIKNQQFVDIISTDKYDASYQDQDGKEVKATWFNTNGYLKGDYDVPEGITVVGGKTGTTGDAGSCLVLLSKNAREEPIISIVLKSDSKDHLYKLMSEMLSNFSN